MQYDVQHHTADFKLPGQFPGESFSHDHQIGMLTGCKKKHLIQVT